MAVSTEDGQVMRNKENPAKDDQMSDTPANVDPSDDGPYKTDLYNDCSK